MPIFQRQHRLTRHRSFVDSRPNCYLSITHSDAKMILIFAMALFVLITVSCFEQYHQLLADRLVHGAFVTDLVVVNAWRPPWFSRWLQARMADYCHLVHFAFVIITIIIRYIINEQTMPLRQAHRQPRAQVQARELEAASLEIEHRVVTEQNSTNISSKPSPIYHLHQPPSPTQPGGPLALRKTVAAQRPAACLGHHLNSMVERLGE